MVTKSVRNEIIRLAVAVALIGGCTTPTKDQAEPDSRTEPDPGPSHDSGGPDTPGGPDAADPAEDAADDVPTDDTPGDVATCPEAPCSRDEPCPPGCPRDTHWCDLGCGERAPGGCSCASSCRAVGDCCDWAGAAPDGTRFDCVGSTCADCRCVPACNGLQCSDGCGGTCPTCSDGDACTAGDSCGPGGCAGVPVQCDDGNPCTVDDCLAGSGCSSSPAEGACTDGDPCTIGDACNGGSCQAGTPSCGCPGGPSCDDDDPCTVDECDSASGVCASVPVDCDDGEPCTADTCSNEGCVYVADPTAAPAAVNCAAVECRLAAPVCALGKTVCGNTPDSAADGLACAGGFCAGGACVAVECPVGARRCLDADTEQICGAQGIWGVGTPCGPQGVCHDDECRPRICDPGARQCEDTAVQVCVAPGVAWSHVETCVAPESVCSAGACVAPVCTPGARDCETPEAVRVCAADGLGWTTEPCPSDERCEDGVCSALVCDADATWCVGAIRWRCDALGLVAEPTGDCDTAGQACSGGECVPKVCAAGTHECVSEGVERVCRQDSLAWDESLCADNERCADGACRPQICEATTLRCMGDDVWECDPLGLSESFVESCDVGGKLCNDGECVSPVCMPGATSCVDGGLQVCDADALGYTVMPCAGGQRCHGGQCLWLLCEPAAPYCIARHAVLCSADGFAFELVQDCGASGQACSAGACVPASCSAADEGCFDAKTARRCKPDGTGFVDTKCAGVCLDGACPFPFCTAGAGICQGDTVHTCNQTGSAYEPTETCGAGTVCSNGACVARLCEPGVKKCENGVAYTCSDNGTQWWPTLCAAGQLCLGTGCVAAVCVPGTLYCAGKVVSECDATGQAGAPVTDCAASGLVCSDGACAPTVCTVGAKECRAGWQSQCKFDGSGWNTVGCGGGVKCAMKDCNPATGQCIATSRNCDDGDPCTTDTCSPAGCSHGPAPNGTRCDDGSPCTTADTCLAGECTSPPLVSVATVLGSTAGYQDGPEATVRLDRPRGMVKVADGAIVIAEGSHRIRRWQVGVGVTTLAGTGIAGFQDGPAGTAQFNDPYGLELAPDGAIYIADSGNHRVRRLYAGMVTTVAGGSSTVLPSPRHIHFAPDGNLWIGNQSSIRALDASGSLFVVSATTSTIRTDHPSAYVLGMNKLADFGWTSRGEFVFQGESDSKAGLFRRNLAGEVTRLAEMNSWTYSSLAILSDDSILYFQNGSFALAPPGKPAYVVVGGGATGVDGVYDQAGVPTGPSRILALPDGRIYVSHSFPDVIRSLTFVNLGCDDDDPCTVDTCESGGCGHVPVGENGACDDGEACTTGDRCVGGECAGVPFGCDDGKLCTDDGCDSWLGTCRSAPNFEHCDDGDACNLRLECSGGGCVPMAATLDIVAGISHTGGFKDGQGTNARFGDTYATLPGIPAIAVAQDGALLVSDALHGAIRRVTRDGWVTTLAKGGRRNGPLEYAEPGAVGGLAPHPSGALAFTSGNQVLRWLGGYQQSICGAASGTSGTTCSDHVFGTLGNIAWALDDGLYFLEPGAHRIWAIDTSGTLRAAAGDGISGFVDGPASGSRLSAPTDLAVGLDGTVYFVDGNKRVGAIRDGEVSTVAGLGTVTTSPTTRAAMKLEKPRRIAVDPAGNLVIVDDTRRWRVEGELAQWVPSDPWPEILDLAFTGDGALYMSHGNSVEWVPPDVQRCDDASPCTVDACDAASGQCTHAPAAPGATCSDGDACTTGDACTADARCTGTPKVCDDGSTCSDDACDPWSGVCVYENRQESCGDACTAGRGCWDATCQSEVALHLHLAGGARAYNQTEKDGAGWSARFNEVDLLCASENGDAYTYRWYGLNSLLRRTERDGTTTTLPLTGVTSQVKSMFCGKEGVAAMLTEDAAYAPLADGSWAPRIANGSMTVVGVPGTARLDRNARLSVQADGSWIYLSGTSGSFSVTAYLVTTGGAIELLGTLKTGAVSGEPKVQTWSDAPDGTWIVQDSTGLLWRFDGVNAERAGYAPSIWRPRYTARGTLTWLYSGTLHELELESRVEHVHGIIGPDAPDPEHGPLRQGSLSYFELEPAGQGRFVYFSEGQLNQVLIPTPACDDGNACTLDSCTGAQASCTHAPASGACDDGDPCTQVDVCGEGLCGGAPIQCDDTEQCVSGECVQLFEGTVMLSIEEQRQLNAWAGRPSTARWVPCYASAAGGSAYALFQACNQRAPSYVLFSSPTSATGGPAHFGAYQKLAWGYSTDPYWTYYVEDPDAYLFSLDRGTRLPLRSDLGFDYASFWKWYLKTDMAGPKYGQKDLVVSSGLDSATSQIGGTYSTAGLPCTDCQSWLTGISGFPITRIEVYYPAP
ncbi:MAG: hypothetical protein IV100_13850 [Myxococcales bacterium]|nr:hypothetical protein [Myxococcales bacterium]